MTLDVATLTFAGGLMALASGVFLLMHWWQTREDQAALSWGVASCGRGVAVSLLAMEAVTPEFLTTIFAPILLTMCNVEFWAAARIFRCGSVPRGRLTLAVG